MGRIFSMHRKKARLGKMACVQHKNSGVPFNFLQKCIGHVLFWLYNLCEQSNYAVPRCTDFVKFLSR